MSKIKLGRFAFLVCSAVTMLVGCNNNSVGGTMPATNLLAAARPYHKTFSYTGREQSFKVPAGVKSLYVVAHGAAGDGGTCRAYCYGDPDYFGRGGRVYALIPVKPGETLYVFVGGRGNGSYTGGTGFNGGGRGGSYPRCRKSHCYGYGGGGASDVREHGDGLDDRIVVAGGGGGGQEEALGGSGGRIGGDGGGYYGGRRGGGGGDGGTQSEGGAGGAGAPGSSREAGGGQGSAGAFGSGGSGGKAGRGFSYGDGGAGSGGGGGYYGGGGGGGSASPETYSAGPYPPGGGGGGSSYVEASAIKMRMWQGWKTATGNGVVVLSWK